MKISFCKGFISFFIAFTAAIVLGSCGSTKKIVYFQGADTVNLEKSVGLYDARIKPKDRLSIYVYTTNSEVSRQFNMSMNMSSSQSGYTTQVRELQDYIVDNEGNINFPVIGFVHVQGLTKRECEKKIHDLIMPYMSATENPIITVRMSSFRIAVIGETGSRVIPVTEEKMSIVEALASAGDLTLYGRRDNILLIRTDSTGRKSTHRMNIADANILNSPYYYLQQDDVIYIEPNKTLINRTAISNNTLWLSLLTTVASFTAMILAIAKK